MSSASGSTTAPAPAAAAAAGGTGTTNNTNSRRRWTGRPSAAATTSSSAKPLLKVTALENAVFDFGPNVKPDQFHRTRLAIENYVQTTIKDPGDIVYAMLS